MTPLAQTIFAPDGDCFRVCVASILDETVNSVPHFFAGGRPGDMWTQEQWSSLRAFAGQRGLQAVWIDPQENDLVRMLHNSGHYYVVFVDGPNGPHCVVHRGGEFVHDPLSRSPSVYSEPFLFVLLEPPVAA